MNNNKILIAAIYIYGVSSLISMAVMGIGSAILVLSFLIYAYKTINTKQYINDLFISVKSQPLFIFSLLWAAVITISLITTKIRNVPITINFNDFKKINFIILPFIVFLSLKYSKINFNKFFNIWTIFFILFGILGIIQFFTPLEIKGILRPQPLPDSKFYTSNGTIGHHLSYSGIMLFGLFYILPFSIPNKINFSTFLNKRNLKNFVFSLTIGLSIFFSYSRMAWAAMFLTILLVVFLRSKVLGIFLILLTTILGNLFYSNNLFDFQNRITNSSWKSERGIVWETHYLILKDFPILGAGWQKSSDLVYEYQKSKGLITKYGKEFVSHAHNIFLNILSSTGILGLIIFLTYIGSIYFTIIKIYKHDMLWGLSFLGCTTSFLLDGLTQWNYGDSKVAHSLVIMLGIMMYKYSSITTNQKAFSKNTT